MSRPLDLGQAIGLAFGHLEAGRLAEARRVARALSDHRPPPPGLDYLCGLLALAEGNGRKASQHLIKACQSSPEAPPPRLAFARAQASQDRLPEAVRAYRQLLVLAPAIADAQAELALCLQRMDQFAASWRPIRQACQSGAASSSRFNALGIACRAHDDLAAADAAFRKAVLLRPDNAKAWANLAGIERRRGAQHAAQWAAELAVRIDPQEVDHWCEWGQSLRDGGDITGAIGAYRRSLESAPDDVRLYWLLAEVLLLDGQTSDAIECYRKLLALAPDDPFGASMELAHLGAAPMPDQAPLAHLRTLYDQYAMSFDADLQGNLGYRGPEILANAIRTHLGAGPFTILDAGCGTGLSGVALRPLASRLDGVDLSPKMVAQAERRGVYEFLQVGDLVRALAAVAVPYDLVVAADVLIYQGDLTPVGHAAHHALRSGGALVFTVENSMDEPVALRADTGRYAHSADHLRAMAAAVGFDLLHLSEVSTRREAGRSVPGLCCILRKT